MRRLLSLLMIISLLCPAIALSETAAPQLCGHWQTQEGTPWDRLTLVLLSDGSYHETRNEDDYGGGSWTLDGNIVSLSGGRYSPARTLTWDGATLIIEDQPMQRIIPEPRGCGWAFQGMISPTSSPFPSGKSFSSSITRSLKATSLTCHTAATGLRAPTGWKAHGRLRKAD